MWTCIFKLLLNLLIILHGNNNSPCHRFTGCTYTCHSLFCYFIYLLFIFSTTTAFRRKSNAERKSPSSGLTSHHFLIFIFLKFKRQLYKSSFVISQGTFFKFFFFFHISLFRRPPLTLNSFCTHRDRGTEGEEEKIL